MSCKMFDMLVDESGDTWTYHYIKSAFKTEAGPNVHPSLADNPLCDIMRTVRLKNLPPKPKKESVLALLRNLAAARVRR